MKILLGFITCMILLSADSDKLKSKSVEAEIREALKWNFEMQKIVANIKILESKRDLMVGNKIRECDSKGKIIGNMDGIIGCIEKKSPTPPAASPTPNNIPDKNNPTMMEPQREGPHFPKHQ